MSSRLIGKSSDFDSEDSWFEPRGDNIEIKIENSAHPTITCIQGLMGVFWKSNCSGLQPRLENGRYFDRYGDRHLRLPPIITSVWCNGCTGCLGHSGDVRFVHIRQSYENILTKSGFYDKYKYLLIWKKIL